MDGQISLTDFIIEKEKDPITNSTCVIIDGKCKNIDWRDLFDGEKYDTLFCVTYVSSVEFFLKATKSFKTIKMIIGIDKEDVRRAIAENFRANANDDGEKFFEKLSESDKKKLIDKEIEVRYSKVDAVIHSKIYLLTNEATGDNRVILGSANLTNTAFECKINQYEEVIVYDNDPIYETYKRRYNFLYEQTEDYVPRKVIENYKNGKFISMADLTPEERTDELIETFRAKNIVPVCNEKILDIIQEVQAEEEKENAEVRATFEVITSLGKKKKGDKNSKYEMKAQNELTAVKGKIIDILYKYTKTEMEFNRFSLTFNDADKKQYIIFNQTENSRRAPELLDRIASTDEIKHSLRNLTAFIDAYGRFVSNPDGSNENLSRIFEIILYSFASAYIFKLRQETIGNKADIPIILVIGGRASSGKSNMLAYIDRILSGRKLSYDQHYFQYKLVDKGGRLADLYSSENTYPLLVDEVPTAFFNSRAASKGEELIKYLSNTLDSKHPVMICTTNTTAFSIPAQVARRIYFLKVDACFDDAKKSEANKYYDSVMNDADNLLFRDYCYRMGERIKEGEGLFLDNTSDYLGVTRQIFEEYFGMAQMDIPEYYPKELYKDYDSRGKEMWRTLYDQAQGSFDYKKTKGMKEATLTVNLKDLVTQNKSDTQLYMNYLRQDIFIEDAGVYVVLRAKPFYEWIGVKGKKKLFFKR